MMIYNNRNGSIIARVVVIIMLIIALGKMPYNYYKLLKFVVCGVSIYGAYLSSFSKKINKLSLIIAWIWILSYGFIVILFNPIIPIHFHRNTWAILDIGVAIVFSLSFLQIKT